jgi:DNA-binding IscR family transcriptional regulator
MEMFLQARLMLALADEETFVLGRDPQTIGIKDILDCVRNAGTKSRVPGVRSHEEKAIDRLLETVEQSAGQTLGGASLQSLILSAEPPAAEGVQGSTACPEPVEGFKVQDY